MQDKMISLPGTGNVCVTPAPCAAGWHSYCGFRWSLNDTFASIASTLNPQELMKAKLLIVTFIGLLACALGHAQTNAASDTSASTPAPAAPAVVPTAPAPAPAADTAAAPAAEPAAATASALPANAVIPLIQFQDVALTTAIENLARQAGLNYILDPRVTFGQPEASGKPAPQPNINLRWENLTAEQALMALLTTYNLQLVEDPKTKVARISTNPKTS